LLAFGRKQVLQPEILGMNGIISNMMSMLRRLLGEDIELSFVAAPDLAMANVDPGKIQQIIMNLVSNARDAMLQGGKLTIETSNANIDENYLKKHPMAKPGEYVMIAISDKGIGMEDEIAERIFEPFFTTKEKGKGSGLGLSTVYGIVKQSNGFVWVYSEPGIGTTFKVYFPATLAGTPAAQNQEAMAAMDAKPTETILVVEDEAPVRALACRILKDRGYKILEAADGLEALRIAQEYSAEINLVVTDVIMPGISGSTLVVRLQAARPGVKALFISGYTGNAIVDHGILDSKCAFLQKPFTMDGLIRKVRSVLNS
jgi:CheY-like chemotaxis protein